MKWRRYGQQVLLILAVGFLLLGCTQVPSPTDRLLANPRQVNSTWINDSAELLSSQVEGELNNRINQLVARTTAEIAIATVSNPIPPPETRSEALALFNRWGIGKRDRNNGVLIFVSSASQRVEIITGKGLGDILPDHQVSESIKQHILPAFRQGDYTAGIVQGTNTIAAILEAKLPSTGLPWRVVWWLGIGSAGLVGLGYGTIALFVRLPRKERVPTKGANKERFQKRMGTLQSYSLPELFHRLFYDNKSQEEIPWLGQICLWLGGAGLGVALALAWQAWLLPNPAWGSWQLVLLSCVVYLVATAFAMLFPALVQQLSFEEAAIGLLFSSMFSLSGCIVLAKDITAVTWLWLAGIIFCLNIVNVICWLITCDGLLLRRPWCYLSQESGQSPQELSSQELEIVLTPTENLGMTMGNLSFRGWREPGLTTPVTRKQVYLVQGTNSETKACEQCQAYTLAKTTRPIKTEPDPPQQPQVLGKRRQNKQKKALAKAEANQNRGLEETVFTCHTCGYEQVIQPPRLNISFDRYVELRRAETGSDQPDTSYPSQSDSGDNSYTHSNDNYSSSSDTSGSDFGGGSSDGSGAGSDW
ncbi:MAG: TPM domain-containing protein [Thermosynechococcaceae cyanobacterium MS004]|nr:TPM domain-containing protein [Thermosynechococcaceae cyanobacterium MS004]